MYIKSVCPVIILFSLISFLAVAGELNQESVNRMLRMKDEVLQNRKAPSNKHETEGSDKASKIMENIQSGDYQGRIRAESDRLKSTVFREHISTSPATTAFPAIVSRPGRLSADERLYVFVSSSVPVQTLRNYAATIDMISDPNVAMVMRGFVGTMKDWTKMLEFSSRVLARQPHCDPKEGQCEVYAANLQIDPLLFRRYGITVVPALVYARGVTRLDAAMSEGMVDAAKVTDHYQMQGDVSLEYFLESLRRETGSASIDAVLTALREGHDGGGGYGR